MSEEPNPLMSSEQPSTIVVTAKKNGDLFAEIEKEPVKIAHFDRKTGYLEFETKGYAQQFIRQCSAVIGTTEKGGKDSGLRINRIGVVGIDLNAGKPAKVPPRPKFNPFLGDTDPPLVRWLFKNFPQEAYILYGVFLDEQGEPIRRSVRRRLKTIVDDRDGYKGVATERRFAGPSTYETGPIAIQMTIEELDDAIIARRPTCLTYTPSEVIGGFEINEEGYEEHDKETPESDE